LNAGTERSEDNFKDVTVWWSRTNAASKQTGRKKRQGGGKQLARQTPKASEFVLKVQKRDKQCVMPQYPNHVEEKAKEFKREQKKPPSVFKCQLKLEELLV
jgi:hypothetical protein